MKGKIKSQGPIQSTVDRSRRQRSKKAIDMKINGSLSGSFGDEFIKPSQSKERSSDSLHGLQKVQRELFCVKEQFRFIVDRNFILLGDRLQNEGTKRHFLNNIVYSTG